MTFVCNARIIEPPQQRQMALLAVQKDKLCLAAARTCSMRGCCHREQMADWRPVKCFALFCCFCLWKRSFLPLFSCLLLFRLYNTHYLILSQSENSLYQATYTHDWLACNGVARICCEEGQSCKLGKGALGAGCSSGLMTNSFMTNAALIERAVSCWQLHKLLWQTTQYLDSWQSDLL